jgi:hypothetical protein
MRITVDIDEATLGELRALTGEKKKSSAVNRAVAEFIRRRKLREFGAMLREGVFDYRTTNEEIEKHDV